MSTEAEKSMIPHELEDVIPQNEVRLFDDSDLDEITKRLEFAQAEVARLKKELEEADKIAYRLNAWKRAKDAGFKCGSCYRSAGGNGAYYLALWPIWYGVHVVKWAPPCNTEIMILSGSDFEATGDFKLHPISYDDFKTETGLSGETIRNYIEILAKREKF